MATNETHPDPDHRLDAARRALEQFTGDAAPTELQGSECLLGRADELEDDAPHTRRRVELIEEAERDGVPHDLAERVYDVAREEGLLPAFAFALVRCGVTVVDLSDTPTDAPSTDVGEPDWVDTPPPPDDAERERRLRTSFRRLRSLLERHATARAALTAFVQEPDVETRGY